MNTTTPSIIHTLVELLAGVLAAVITAYTPALLRLIRERIANATAREALAFVAATAANVVASKAGMVRDMKDAAKPGEWTPEMAAAVARNAVRDIKDTAPAQVAVIQRGLVAGKSIDAVLHDMAEAQVEELRRRPALADVARVSGAPPQRDTIAPPTVGAP